MGEECKSNKAENFRLRLGEADMRRLSYLAIKRGQSKAAVIRDLVRKAVEVAEQGEVGHAKSEN